jgi:Sulfocyanin (SoxE) domain
MTTNFTGFRGRILFALCAGLLACSPRERAAATPPAASASEPVSATLAEPSQVNPDSFPWLVVDSAARTASLELVATRKPGVPSALINGYRTGEARIVVPVGWTVKWNYRSADSTTPHSLVVMVQREKIPLEGGRPSFSNAMTRMVTEGLKPGQSDQSTFEAEEAGWYWMMCGVPSHGLEGEWLELRVDPDAKTAKVEPRRKREP